MRSVFGSLALAAFLGCASPSLKAAGEECVASSECADGLVCDFGRTPPVCAGNLTIDATEIDAPGDGPAVDAAAVDAAAVDAAVDAVVDATVDAAVDAATDAPPDA